MARSWIGDGPAFELEWGGWSWTLRADGPRPGLRPRGERFGPVLALEGLAEVGRWVPGALGGATLVTCQRHRDRVEATYAPADWGELTVRAAWCPRDQAGVDLEIQVSARSVDLLKTVEVLVSSDVRAASDAPPSGPGPCWVEPRDPRAAALSYDGREPDLASLVTMPPRDHPQPTLVGPNFGPWLCPDLPALAGKVYAELVHPDDCSRRLHAPGGGPPLALRTALFGYDLERGVVLRGRLRALWLDASTDFRAAAFSAYDAFLREPPPLST